MIKKKYIGKSPSGKQLMEIYSDAGFYIRKVNGDFLYSKAIDVLPLKYKYVETDIAITSNTETEVESTTEE